MKINPVGNSDAISNYQQMKNSTVQKSSPTANVSDSVELSEGAQKYSSILKAANEEMEKLGLDEQARVDYIQTRMSEGSYQVSAKDVAQSILDGIPNESE